MTRLRVSHISLYVCRHTLSLSSHHFKFLLFPVVVSSGGKRVQKYNLFSFRQNIFSIFFCFLFGRIGLQYVTGESFFQEGWIWRGEVGVRRSFPWIFRGNWICGAVEELRKSLCFCDISIFSVFISLSVSVLQFFAFFSLLVPVLFVSLQVQTGGSPPGSFYAKDWIREYWIFNKSISTPPQFPDWYKCMFGNSMLGLC